MAVYAAHLTRTLNGAPSVFQVTAQEALGATVKPALRKVVEYLSTVYPARLGWAPRWFDELFLLLDAALQHHYLKHYAASFSESFYGLVRAPLSASSEFYSGTRLPRGLERGSLLLLVLLPYLRGRLAAAAEEWRARDEDGELGKSKSDSLRRWAVRAHSLLHLSLEALRLAQLARYLAGAARSPSPALWALGLTLRDAPALEHDAPSWRELGRDLARGDFAALAAAAPLGGALLLRGVEQAAFLVQLLRWWEARGAQAAQELPAPAPPEKDEHALQWKNKCPICLQPWKTPTVLTVSGYVFCYACISRHLQSSASCPATRAPAARDQLVRVFVTD